MHVATCACVRSEHWSEGVRVWGFNNAFPYAPGKYNDKQGGGLDYVIAAAGRRGIRVELALANFWNGELPQQAVPATRHTASHRVIAAILTPGRPW